MEETTNNDLKNYYTLTAIHDLYKQTTIKETNLNRILQTINNQRYKYLEKYSLDTDFGMIGTFIRETEQYLQDENITYNKKWLHNRIKQLYDLYEYQVESVLDQIIDGVLEDLGFQKTDTPLNQQDILQSKIDYLYSHVYDIDYAIDKTEHTNGKYDFFIRTIQLKKPLNEVENDFKDLTEKLDWIKNVKVSDITGLKLTMHLVQFQTEEDGDVSENIGQIIKDEMEE